MVVSQAEDGAGGIDLDVTLAFQPVPGAGSQSGVVRLTLGNDTHPATWVNESAVALECGAPTSSDPGAQSCAALAALGGCLATVRLGLGPLGIDERWWPWDLGSQPLYTLLAEFVPDSGSPTGEVPGEAWYEGDWPVGEGVLSTQAYDERAQALETAAALSTASVLSRRVGLRTVGLVTEALPAGGESFYFTVNGVPAYARGANAVPADVFESRVGAADLALQVADAKAAGMNMLRVWGGGRYAGDALYEAADAAGVMIWQEVMLACAVYPRDTPFLEEVRRGGGPRWPQAPPPHGVVCRRALLPPRGAAPVSTRGCAGSVGCACRSTTPPGHGSRC